VPMPKTLPAPTLVCVSCCEPFTRPSTRGLTYEMPSLFDPTVYACSFACYSDWASSKVS
jgi:hypothetical protein